MKTAKAWLSVTRTPLRQRAIALLSGLSGHPRVLAAELEAEELVRENGADLLLGKLELGYSYITARKLPHKFYETIFHPSSKRQQKEGLATYVSRKKLLFRQLHSSGCALPEVAQGLLMLKDSQVNAAQHETLLTWLQGAYTVDEVSQALMKLEQPRFLPGVTHSSSTAHVFLQEGGESEQFGEQFEHGIPWEEQLGAGELTEGFVEDGATSDIEEDLNHLLEATDELSEEQAQLIYLTSGGLGSKYPAKGGAKGKGNYKDYRAQIQAARLSRGFTPSATNTGASSSSFQSKQSSQRDVMDKQTWRQQRLQKIIAKSRCAKCGQIGHWARSCPNPAKQQHQHAAAPSTNFFVHAAPCASETSNWLEGYSKPCGVSRQEGKLDDMKHELAILDSGAQTAVCGRSRWQSLIKAYYDHGLHPELISERATTTHGIGGIAKTSGVWRLPVGIAGVAGLIDVTIIEHESIPLLLPISLQRDLGMVLSLPTKTATWSSLNGAESKIVELPTGHVAISITDWPECGWYVPHDVHSQLAQVSLHGVAGDRSLNVGPASRQDSRRTQPAAQEDSTPRFEYYGERSATCKESPCRMDSASQQCPEDSEFVQGSEGVQHLACDGFPPQSPGTSRSNADPTPTLIDSSSDRSVATSCATYRGHRSFGSPVTPISGESHSSSRAASLSPSSTVHETSCEQGEEVVHMLAVRDALGEDRHRSGSGGTCGRENAGGEVSGESIQRNSQQLPRVGDWGIRDSGAQQQDACQSQKVVRMASQQAASGVVAGQQAASSQP
eukprot:6466113-Amphidinium_carterae.2